MSTRRHLVGAAVLGLAATLTVPVALGQGGGTASAREVRQPAELIGAAPAAALRQAPAKPTATTERSRYISLRTSLLPGAAKGQQLSLGFFHDARFTAVIDRVDRQPLFTSWSGSLDTQFGTFVITRTSDRYSITAFTMHGTYSVSRTAAGLYQVSELDGRVTDQPDTVTEPAADTAAARTAERHKKVRGGDDGSVEDLLVVWTAGAAAHYGGDAAMANIAAQQVALTNAIYAQSGVGTSVRLVGAAPVTGAEAGGDLSSDLGRMDQKGDGAFDEIFGLVKRTHADDTIMIEQPNEVGIRNCGLAHLEKGQPAAYARAVVAGGDCIESNFSFSHELGHNQGVNHDPYVIAEGAGGGTDSQYPFGFGYVAPNYAFRTVMAYNDECRDQAPSGYCPRVPYFSNPSVVYAGQATGTADRSNNARAITLTRKRVASHQQSQLYPRGKVAIKPAPRFHHGRVHVKFKGWVNTGVHSKFTWYRNGKKIKHAHGRTYLPKRKDVGKQLSVVVTGKKKLYAPISVGSNARKVKGSKHKHGHHRGAGDDGVPGQPGRGPVGARDQLDLSGPTRGAPQPGAPLHPTPMKGTHHT